jgi:hypothetical protein
MNSKFDKMLLKGPKVMNIGLVSFFEACQVQGIPVVHIKWEPPAQGDPDLLELLEKLL